MVAIANDYKCLGLHLQIVAVKMVAIAKVAVANDNSCKSMQLQIMAVANGGRCIKDCRWRKSMKYGQGWSPKWMVSKSDAWLVDRSISQSTGWWWASWNSWLSDQHTVLLSAPFN